MDFESLAAAGSMGGSGGVVVMDETTCMVRVGEIVSRFYHHESCGQCTQCCLWRLPGLDEQPRGGRPPRLSPQRRGRRQGAGV